MSEIYTSKIILRELETKFGVKRGKRLFLVKAIIAKILSIDERLNTVFPTSPELPRRHNIINPNTKLLYVPFWNSITVPAISQVTLYLPEKCCKLP